MIIATMIISDRNEPFLQSCLESVNGSVDLVIINDNSQNSEKNPNMDIIKKSKLFASGKVKLLFNKFQGFADARNKYLEYIKTLSLSDDSWLIKLDSDEVHSHILKIITREILPALPSSIGVVDTYFFHFMQSFDYIYSIDRRHDLFVRYNKDLLWKGDVHEKLTGQKGARIALPYLFYHYGYVNPKDDILERWKLYARCGDNTYEDLNKIEKNTFLNEEGKSCAKFTFPHPVSMKKIIEDMKKDRKEEFENYNTVINNYLKNDKKLKIQNFFRFFNYWFRVYSRLIQLNIRFIYNPKMVLNFFKLLPRKISGEQKN